MHQVTSKRWMNEMGKRNKLVGHQDRKTESLPIEAVRQGVQTSVDVDGICMHSDGDL